MAKKISLKAFVLVLCGFVIGAILAGGLVAWRYSKMFKDQYYSGILSNTNTAYMIRANREDDLLKNVELNIRQCVQSADSLWPDEKARLGAFWYLQGYYNTFDLSVPNEIKPILDKLPPQPPRSCRVKRLEKEHEQQTEPPAPADPE